MMKNWRIIAISVICALLATGAIWLVSQPPRGEMVRLLPAPTHKPLVVHVSGAVAHPGVYSLPAGSRVQDAILAAGDVASGANPDALNLAAPLADGAKIDVPLLNPPTATLPAASGPPPEIAPVSSRIDINVATQSELESLPGIGPVIAQRIIAYRDQNGPFSTPEAIQNVSGIGPGIFEKIRDLITVASTP